MQRTEKEVDGEFQKLRAEIDSIQIQVDPSDVNVSSEARAFWEHEIQNESPFEVVCRVRATNSSVFGVNRNVFRLSKNGIFVLKVTRAPFRIRSHHIKIDVVKCSESFSPLNLHDYFMGPYARKTFVIRYHRTPRYWSDALEMNDGLVNEEVNAMVTAELRKTSKEWKTSAEDSSAAPSGGNGSSEYVELIEDPAIAKEASRMNMTNVFLMALQDVDEGAEGESLEDNSDLWHDDGPDPNDIVVDQTVSE